MAREYFRVELKPLPACTLLVAAQQAVEADGRASGLLHRLLAPVEPDHGRPAAHKPRGLLMRPQLNSGTLGGRMRLTSDSGDFVELEPRSEQCDRDLSLLVRVSRDGFVGETETWIEHQAWLAFTQALVILEERRSGEAKVQSMSPGELDLKVTAVDRRGHLGVEGLIGRREFDRQIELRFSAFSFEPSQIVAFARAARQISEALASRPSR